MLPESSMLKKIQFTVILASKWLWVCVSTLVSVTLNIFKVTLVQFPALFTVVWLEVGIISSCVCGIQHMYLIKPKH